MLASLHLRAGRTDEALDVYRQGARASPDSYDVHRRFKQLLLQERCAAEAVEIIRRTARLALPSEAWGHYADLADLQQSMGLQDEALRSWEKAVALDENNVLAWRGLVATAAALENRGA